MGIMYPRPGNPSVSVSGGGTDDRSPKAAYGTAAEWAAANPVLALGEQGYETDTYVHKIGDGSTAWSSLTTAGSATFAGVAALGPRARPPAPVLTSMVTTFQTGHGWFTGGADNALKNLNDTSDFILGSQAATIVSKTDATIATFSNYPITAIDMSSKQFVAWVKVDDMTRLGSLILRVSSGADLTGNYYNLRASGGANQNAIINGNEWVPITFGWADATTVGSPNRAAITAIGFYATPNGAGTATYIRYNGLGIIAEPSAVYANGVVSITFDDTYLSQYTLGKPALDKYGYKATAYTIVENVDAVDGLHLSTTQLQRLQDTCGWEISGHAYTIAAHNSAGGLPDLSASALDTELRQLKAWLLTNGFRGSDWYAYPQGKFNSTVEGVVSRYFSASVTTDHYVAQTLPFYRPLRIARMSVTSSDSTATIQAEIDKAYANRTWLILCFHKILSSGAAGSVEYNVASFTTVVDYLNTKGIPVRTIGEVLSSLNRL